MKPWEGHRHMSRAAVSAYLATKTKDKKWLRRYLDGIGRYSVLRDIGVATHFSGAGQKHHFMRRANQSQMSAYTEGVNYIRDLSYKASKLLNLAQFGPSPGAFEGSIEQALGYAFHAFQDSYSESHVVRQQYGPMFKITHIQVFDEANRAGSEDVKPHGVYDKSWNQIYDRRHARAAKKGLAENLLLGCFYLLAIAIDTAESHTDAEFQAHWQTNWRWFQERFLAENVTRAAS